MLSLSARNQFIIGSILTLLIIATRGHHFATLNHLPSVSRAAFFLAGIYLGSVSVLAGFFALTSILDYTAITYGGVSGFCVTPAYAFLLPAYGSLWLAGRWYAVGYRFAWRSLVPLGAAMLVGAVLCELFLSGGFYFFSGRFVETNASEFGARLLRFFPLYLKSLTFYVIVAAIAHTFLVFVQGIRDSSRTLSA